MPGGLSEGKGRGKEGNLCTQNSHFVPCLNDGQQNIVSGIYVHGKVIFFLFE